MHLAATVAAVGGPRAEEPLAAAIAAALLPSKTSARQSLHGSTNAGARRPCRIPEARVPTLIPQPNSPPYPPGSLGRHSGLVSRRDSSRRSTASVDGSVCHGRRRVLAGLLGGRSSDSASSRQD